MTNEEKNIVLQDLSARLPYGVKCDRYGHAYELVEIDIKRGLVYLLKDYQFLSYSIPSGDEIKPYLRSLSSMTKEELQQLQNIIDECGISWKPQLGYDVVNKIYIKGEIELGNCIPLDVMVEIINWLLKHHFDFRGLIEKGLAIEAPKDMYNQKFTKNGF